MMKLNLLPSISQRSFQVSLRCSRFSVSPLFGLRDCLLLLPDLSYYKFSPLGGCCFVPYGSACPKSKTPSSLLHLSYNVSMPERGFCLLYGLSRGPLAPSCQSGSSRLYYSILRLSQGHVQSHFGALVLFSEAKDRQFQGTFPIQADITEASRESKPLLDIRTDCSLQLLNFGNRHLVGC